ncbi:DciA family protein [Thermomonas sp. HDW16]|uniref:DciA family protein n=1 Tax=Thermomonas sp. HDW16 TaxID=2714945 RepID=UPI00140B889D|nr:DUF721 domain-containing protein [Thermomonas sp. HDW16]
MPSSRPSSPSDPRGALQALLTEASGDTLRRAQWLDTVDQLLRPHLPPGLAAHARLANVRGDMLVFVVDAPVWHAKLRLATRELVDAARSVGLDVTGLSVKTTLQPLRPLAPAARTAPPMSAAGQSQLEAALALLRSDDAKGAEAGHKAGARRTRKAPTEPTSGAS